MAFFSTRSSFHCFVSSEFRVLVEYFYRKRFVLLNDDTLNALLITNKFYKKEKLLENEKYLLDIYFTYIELDENGMVINLEGQALLKTK